jgi:ribosome recycling factor
MTDHLKPAAQEKMEKAMASLHNEFKKIRTGKAQVSMLDSIRVNYYGALTPLAQVAGVSTPDAKSFLISPWESAILKEIEQAIIKSDLGMTPMNDGKVIRLRVPDVTEQRRKDLAKLTKKTAEDARVSVRMARRDANEEVKVLLKDKNISEDEAKKQNEEIQKLTDEYIKKVDVATDEKEKSILTI